LKKTLKQDVETRWFSKVTMLESVQDGWAEISEILNEKQATDKLDCIPKQLLADLVDLLKSFRLN